MSLSGGLQDRWDAAAIAYSALLDSDTEDEWDEYMKVGAFDPSHKSACRRLELRQICNAKWQKHEQEVCACGMRNRCHRARHASGQDMTCGYLQAKQAREPQQAEGK
jgi:hypothetical protein